MTLPTTLTEWRESAGLTQRELATLSSITPAYISHLERGRFRPTAQCARKIADALGERLDVQLQPADLFPGNFRRVPRGIVRRIEQLHGLVVYLEREVADCPECGGVDESCARCYPLRAAMAKAKAVLA